MNRANVEKLLAELKSPTLPKIEFDMEQWGEETVCGTVCCLGGLANILEANGKPEDSYEDFVDRRVWEEGYAKAKEWLELANDEASMLFLPWNSGVRYPPWFDPKVHWHPAHYTKTKAIDCLEGLLRTGEVRWG